MRLVIAVHPCGTTLEPCDSFDCRDRGHEEVMNGPDGVGMSGTGRFWKAPLVASSIPINVLPGV